MSIDYARNYIRKALTAKELEAPDKNEAESYWEALIGIFMAHHLDGTEGVKKAWDTLKGINPNLVAFEKPELLVHADSLKSLSVPTYLLADYPIYHRGLNVLVGKSGSGKSFVALDIAGRLAVNQPVVYIAGEGVNGYSARWESWKSFHQCRETHLYFWTEALQVLDDAGIWTFFKTIEDKHLKKIGMVIIDTLARSAVGLDENSARDMGQFIAAVDRIKDTLGCSVLVVHHTGKSGDMRGSTALYGAADSVLSQSINNGVIRLTNKPDFGGKNKYASSQFDTSYRIVEHSSGGFDGGVLVETEPIEGGVEEDTLSDNQITILKCLATHPEGTMAKVVMKDTKIKQPTVYRNLTILADGGFVELKNNIYKLSETGKDFLKDME